MTVGHCALVGPRHGRLGLLARGRDAYGMGVGMDAYGRPVRHDLLEPARKAVERYQGFVILHLCREDWGTGCLGMISLASSIDGVPNAIQAT